MGLTLACIESVVFFIGVCSTILVWGEHIPVDWFDVITTLGQGFVVSLGCFGSFYYNDLYDLHVVRSFSEFASRLLQSLGGAFILLATIYVIVPATHIGTGPFVTSFLVIVGLLLLLRTAAYSIMHRRLFTERVLVLGMNSVARNIIEEIERRPHLQYTIVGVVDDTMELGESLHGYPVLGGPHQLDKIIEKSHPDRIIVTLTERRGRMPLRQLLESRMSGVMVEDGIEMYEHITGKLAIESLAPSSLILSKDFRQSRTHFALCRGVSLLACIVGLVGFAPLFGLLALAIKLDSPGPVFFMQRRGGRNGKPFQLIKFRTMHPAKSVTSEWMQDNCGRITRVGWWLRKFHLDELPQCINILRGDMNLVGPRPHPVSNLNLFIEQIPYYALRSIVRPGVTGWAQVRYGYANNLAEETEKMRYDLYYIKHVSLWLDLRILFDTVKLVLCGRGSTGVVVSALGAMGE